MSFNTPILPLTVQFRGELYTASYFSTGEIVTVNSKQGSASAPKAGAGVYATAISLYFSILRTLPTENGMSNAIDRSGKPNSI
jgi:hypothetical protein